MRIHEFLDFHYGADGDEHLQERLAAGADPEQRAGPAGETLLHVAVRRRRLSAVQILLDHGARMNARNGHGKTAYAHAIRRGFSEIAAELEACGADTSLNEADQLAVAITRGDLDSAAAIMTRFPQAVRTGNPEEDRLLADVAGRNEREPVALLIEAGADLTAPGLDSGTPLHQAAWFGQPENARLLLDADAPVDIFDATHGSSPIGWAVHGSAYSGGAPERVDSYIALVRMLLESGSCLHYPGAPGKPDYLDRLRRDAPPGIRALLPEHA